MAAEAPKTCRSSAQAARIMCRDERDDAVNLVTHLTHDRIQALLAGGGSADGGAGDAGEGGTITLASATAQAESELFAALQIGGTGFNPAAGGTQMNLLTGSFSEAPRSTFSHQRELRCCSW